MKPLVYYCRWQGATLRLRGRDKTAVWGQFAFNGEGKETTQRFHYNLGTRELTLYEPAGERTVTLDDMGVVITPG